MDQERFAQGMRNYRSGNYALAAQDFLESAEAGIARGNGSAFHQAGNAFFQLDRNADALTMYQNALRDDTYANMSAVYANIGHVYAKEGKLAQSVEAYELSATYPECEKPYRCYLRVAQNHMKLGSIDKAAIAYKKAALDVNNPARSKALYNLALCLLELKQPLSAVESLKLALDFDDCANKEQVYTTLGIAYALLDSDEEAVDAFEHAQYLLGEQGLGPIAEAAYAASKARLVANAPAEPVLESTQTQIDQDHAISLTGEIKSIATNALEPRGVGESVVIGSDEEVAQFFALTDEELVEQGRRFAKADREGWKWWKTLLVILLGLLLVASLAVGVTYYLGLGYPPPDEVVLQTLRAYGAEQPIAETWSLSENDAQQAMASAVPREAVFTIDPPDGRMSEATVQVKATNDVQTQTDLVFTLERFGIGWKITGVRVSQVVEGNESGTAGSGAPTTEKNEQTPAQP